MAQYSRHISELITYLREDQKRQNPKLWQSIDNLVKYKKAKYENRLYDPVTGNGITKEIEVAQDKFIDTLCNFGLTKDEIIYILSSEPSKIKELKLPSLTKDQEQEINQKEYDVGYFLKRIEKDNAQDQTKRALGNLLKLPERHFPAAKQKGETNSSHVLEWPSEIAELVWLNLPRSQKVNLIIDMWTSREDPSLKEFTQINQEPLETLFRYYRAIEHKQTELDSQLENDKAVLQKDGKYDKILKYSNRETQCSSVPAFFGQQSNSDVWQYARNENAGYFSALSEYSAINDILLKIDSIIFDTSTPAGKKKYFEKLIRTIETFDKIVLGESRDDLKKWLSDEIKAFLDLWTVFRKKHLNLTLEGPPGSGKTTIAEGLGPIFSKLGILLIGKYKVVSRSDLVGQYIGETANKVKGILNSMMESVLFIDEAYAIACSAPVSKDTRPSEIKYDQFGIEAINEIVNFLDKNSGSIMIIAAGYEQDMKTCFFGANVGIERRFPKRYHLADMPAGDLLKIFNNRLTDTVQDPNLNQTLTEGAQQCVAQLFNETPQYWINQAGDMGNLAEIVAGKKAARGAPLDAIDIYNTVSEMFASKDLSRMQSLPAQIEQDKLANWGQEKINQFLGEQTYLSDEERETLKSMLTTGERIEKLDQSDIMWMDPASKYNLIENIKDAQKKSDQKIKQFFDEQSNQSCNIPPPVRPLNVLPSRAVSATSNVNPSQKRKKRRG